MAKIPIGLQLFSVRGECSKDLPATLEAVAGLGYVAVEPWGYGGESLEWMGFGATDLRKSRSALDNVVITSTNAAAALEQVMPEIADIGFMADSVRIPTSSVSLIILNVTFQSEALPDGTVSVSRDTINAVYREASEAESHGLLRFTDEQNVSMDMLGEDAAVVIEGTETHTRTGFVDLRVPAAGEGDPPTERLRVPLTHVKILGWYDNEMGSYTNRLAELTTHVAAEA